MKSKNNSKVMHAALMLTLSVLFSATILMTGCSKSVAQTEATTVAAVTTTQQTTAAPTATPSPAETAAATPASAFAVNPLTGTLDMDAANVGKRSVSVSINNHPSALPSRGVSAADVIYEFETEGGQTRLLALFADVSKAPEVGSLRSARIIACDLSAGTNSIFIHYGENARVPDYVANNKIDEIDGNIYSKGSDKSVNGEITLASGIYFWRDSYWLSKRALEHTAVTNGANMLRAIAGCKITLEGETPSLFTFTSVPSPALAAGTDCNKLVVYFSTNNDDSTFTYNAQTKLYEKSEYGGDPQMDETTGTQIAVKNVVTLYANIVPHGDTTIDAFLNDGGTGYYASEGKIIEINWTKAGPHAPIVITDKAGNLVEVNVGKSYINVVRKTVAAKTKIS
ncbi:MAG: DUF3048 domain-containing protein [Eubacteriales bacterium]